jgi:arsenical pump membrane protein
MTQWPAATPWSHWAIWLISAAAIGGVVARPWGLPEAWWALAGAAALTVSSLISAADAAAAVLQGSDVYLFLAGMMILSELARREKLFDWLAAYAVAHSRGSPRRLFTLVYAVGILVTVLLSNDATAVVLTPAVYAATRRAGTRPLPYLLICAFIANAASFVLPISNPANLVVFATHLPSLATWLQEFSGASVVSILLTFLVLRWTQRSALSGHIAPPPAPLVLTSGGRLAAAGIAATAALLLTASALEWPLGLPTLLAAAATALAIWFSGRESPWPVIQGVSWSILPLVAGLFVLARGIESTGLLEPIARVLKTHAGLTARAASLAAGAAVGLACNVVNNLPLGLVAGSIAREAHLSTHLTGALLIGVDLGPNLSVTGSLATLLWLVALRREGENIGAARFLMLGALVMPPALLGSLAVFAWLAPG